MIIFSNTFIYSQNWKIQHPYPSPDTRDIYFINDSIGWSVGNSGNVLKTTNGGLEWFQQNIESNNDLHSVFFIDDKKGWIAGIDGLFKTINSGENWDRINDASKFNNIYFFDKNKGVISGFDNGIFVTDDGGKSLKNIPVETADEGDIIMDISFPNQKFGWLAVLNNNIEKGKVYHTSDSGKTWEKQKSFNEDWVTSVHFLDTLNGWVTLYSNDKYKEKNFHSCDGGKTWLSQSCIDDDLNRFGNIEDIYIVDQLN